MCSSCDSFEGPPISCIVSIKASLFTCRLCCCANSIGAACLPILRFTGIGWPSPLLSPSRHGTTKYVLTPPNAWKLRRIDLEYLGMDPGLSSCVRLLRMAPFPSGSVHRTGHARPQASGVYQLASRLLPAKQRHRLGACARLRSSAVRKSQRESTYVTDRFRYVASSPQSAKQTSYAASLSILLSPALLIIDHIHFQYNGLLYGILILSLVNARKQASLLSGGLLFAGLLCMKHIYLYLAPAYFVYLLRVYCLSSKSVLRVQFGNSTKLASGLLLISGAMFGPFIYWKQTNQMLSRLFPFARGLCHAYWAPNIWSMYSFTDRVVLLGMPAILPCFCFS